MTLQDIKLISFQKIFQNEEKVTLENLDEYINEDEYAVYFNNMIPAINEAIQNLDKYQRNIETKEIITQKEEVLDLFTLPNFKVLDKIYVGGKIYTGYTVVANRYINIPPNSKMLVSYRTNPIYITESTPADTKIPLKDEIAVLIPFYVASEILKDENIQLATIYRNQYEAGKSELENPITTTPNIELVYQM